MRNIIIALVLLIHLESGGCREAIEKGSSESSDSSLKIVSASRNPSKETVNSLLDALAEHREIRSVKVLRLGDATGSSYRARSESFELPEAFDCEGSLLKDAPMKVRMLSRERERWLTANKPLCAQREAVYKATAQKQISKIRDLLLQKPEGWECLSLTDIGRRLVRDIAAGEQDRRIVLLTTGVNTPKGCVEKVIEAATLPDYFQINVVQIPLPGENKLIDQRTKQILAAFPAARITPAATPQQALEFASTGSEKR